MWARDLKWEFPISSDWVQTFAKKIFFVNLQFYSVSVLVIFISIPAAVWLAHSGNTAVDASVNERHS